MRKLRRALLALGLLFFVVGGYLWWRAMRPPLTNEQQIAANLNAAQRALEQRSANGILHHLAPEFAWSGTSRDEFSSLMKGTLFQWREVRMRRSDEVITINGDTATSSGAFQISYRSGIGQPRESRSGRYKLHWRRSENQWKVIRVEGAASGIAE